MNLDAYIKALQALVTARSPDLGDEDSVLSLLYEAHSESNAMYDDEIKANFHALYEAMNGMPLQDMDRIVYPVCTLCRSHQKSGFIEGIRVGVLLCTELAKEEYQ
ncbi:MAG: hypothetical protein IJZ39_01310 [Oscillospiraceae bacterium]|nr:hypothetical protein [Oscillospiraceae bacterium]